MFIKEEPGFQHAHWHDAHRRHRRQASYGRQRTLDLHNAYLKRLAFGVGRPDVDPIGHDLWLANGILKQRYERGCFLVITESVRRLIDEIAALPAEEQERVAAAMRFVLHQPLVTSDAVRPEIMAAFEQVMNHSSAVLDYLRDK